METEKKQGKPRKQYTDESCPLVLEEGKSITETARGVGAGGLGGHRWLEQARADRGKSTRGSLQRRSAGENAH